MYIKTKHLYMYIYILYGLSRTHNTLGFSSNTMKTFPLHTATATAAKQRNYSVQPTRLAVFNKMHHKNLLFHVQLIIINRAVKLTH